MNLKMRSHQEMGGTKLDFGGFVGVNKVRNVTWE